METSVISKAEVRRRVLDRRKKLSPAESRTWDEAIRHNVKSLITEGKQTVYTYISVRGEAGTEKIIDWYLQCGFRVAVPRVIGKEIYFFYIRGIQDLEPGSFQIPEPLLSCEKAVCPDAPVLLPGVGFSRDGWRVGYGAGFYDRFLSREPEHDTIGLAYDFQIFSSISHWHLDRPVRRIVTPSGIIACTGAM